jgi:hypothetical protein
VAMFIPVWNSGNFLDNTKKTQKTPNPFFLYDSLQVVDSDTYYRVLFNRPPCA